ncbi:MAG: haloalkane dehalogenase [Polyangiales bacterium]
MQRLRTPDDRFAALPDFMYAPHYLDVPSPEGDAPLRMAYVDEGPRDGAVVLMLHGEPSWSFLYRKVIAEVVAAGHRAIAPDLIGFGRSDKPALQEHYTYQRHVDWLVALLKGLDVQGVTLLCQDWGGLLGLRLVAEHGARFARVVAANTFLPTGDQTPPEAFFAWQRFSQSVPELPIGMIIGSACTKAPSPEVIAAYEAPFPDETFKAGARRFPMLVPTSPDDPAAPANRAAWKQLEQWNKPFLTAFSDGDPITRGADRVLQARVPGAAGRVHPTLVGGGHFLQEDVGEELGRVVVNLIAETR